ncbi:hypothetical protein SD37_26910 [Amycolatopsis orientalis]|uniref:Methyltransferase domain-containing protein n=1 Tax=Amycolatopsis orientalis TaxID=31958 RepID=A0A193C3E2_AMYOR|nr:class I SAM-dependent methyltransferase [Amycolatopsis orientalis]ANN18895.1 hypothetical protein SD37_26910 [Amycolatopsis orientalis]
MYTYPDVDDRITLRFIDEAEPYPGYWARSDERAMARAANRLAKLLGPRETVAALDVGCGPGRMLSWLARLAGTIVAIDPDAARLARATEMAAALGDSAGIETRVSTVDEVTEGPFDLVLCSHIIQHIPTTELVPLLNRLRELTAPDGVLVLTYTRAPVGAERFTLDRVTGGGVESLDVDQARFDEAAQGRLAEKVLPIHYRDPIQLAQLGRRLGWSEVWSWSFHVLQDSPRFRAVADRDELVNATPALLRKFGRDAVALWRPQTATGAFPDADNARR